jgi:hypothetical protein
MCWQMTFQISYLPRLNLATSSGSLRLGGKFQPDLASVGQLWSSALYVWVKADDQILSEIMTKQDLASASCNINTPLPMLVEHSKALPTWLIFIIKCAEHNFFSTCACFHAAPYLSTLLFTNFMSRICRFIYILFVCLFVLLQGGETFFPFPNISIKPKRGMAAVWKKYVSYM